MASTLKTVKVAASRPFKTDSISPSNRAIGFQVTQQRSRTVTVISRSIVPA
ncbi:MAG: hypothetical protein HC895_19320 [Leptolyngbyaceae cyanobacterium SM1_3_5]|nr:hypothetical protein [Leptolyngbyaceae cyanobacterium SM1_3_5]